jgi:two-component system response regulator AtoC
MTGHFATPCLDQRSPLCLNECCNGERIEIDHLAERAEQLGDMVVSSAPMLEVVRIIRRVAPHKTPVLIHGESGTGKELVARALHTVGGSPQGPFVVFNCSNLIETLAESQLFGHVRGSFTDARNDSPGYFRSANNGTLFLDEIGELPLALQPKLLRAVETHEIQPVGSIISSRVDVRIVAATNRDLGAMVKAGTFRADLYYRLNGATISIPGLTARDADIEPLIAHFVRRHSRRVRYISRAALTALRCYEWPGNVRQLAHVIETALLMTDGDCLDLPALPPFMFAMPPVAVAAPADLAERRAQNAVYSPLEFSATRSLDDITRQALMAALEHAEGQRQRAAKLLGVSRARLYRMLERYNLTDFARPRTRAKSPDPTEVSAAAVVCRS